MHALEYWFQRASAREKRAVYLEDALLSGRFAAYGFYRLRYFLGRTLVVAVLHIIEFTILAFIFSHYLLVSAIFIRTAGIFISAWWWGGLESMRGELRRLYREGKTRRISTIVPRWFRLALVCSIIIGTWTLIWVLLDIIRPMRNFQPFHLYVLATGLQVSLSLLSRTFHSVIYALRRIYRPFSAIVGVQLFAFGGTILAWPIFRSWSYPLMMIPATILANALTFFYVHRVYRFLGLKPLQMLSAVRAARGRTSIVTRDFFLAGWAYSFIRIDMILILALFHNVLRDPNDYQLFLLFYLISPFVHGAYEWAQLFYFDFKRLELQMFVRLKKRFEIFVQRIATIIGGLFCLLACVCGTLMLDHNLGVLYGLLFFFFLVRSHLAFHQIRSFSEVRYGALILTGLFVVAGVLLIRSSVAGETGRLGLFTLILCGAILGLVPRCMSTFQANSRSGLLSLPDWLSRLMTVRQPVRLGYLSVARDVSSNLTAAVAKQILRSVPTVGAVTLVGSQGLAWYEVKKADESSTGIPLLRHGAGLIKGLKTSPYADSGMEALDLGRETGIFRGLLNEQRLARAAQQGDDDIKQRFQAAFPDGIMYDTAERKFNKLECLSRPERREIMFGAIQYAKDLFKRSKNARFDVTTLCERGEIRMIFCIPKTGRHKAYRDWRSYINIVNVCRAIYPRKREEGITMIPMELKRIGLWSFALGVPALALGLIPVEDQANGTFQLRPKVRAEIRAPAAGFLRAVQFGEGDYISAGTTLAQLEIPDLSSRITRKGAEIAEVRAILRLLESGTRPEQVAEQRARVELAERWREQARRHLSDALQENERHLKEKIDGFQAEFDYARQNFERAKKLLERQVISAKELDYAKKEYQVRQSEYKQSQAEQRSRLALVILQAQSELIKREQALAEARSNLVLMEAGSRPERIEAERARLERLHEEVNYLVTLEKKMQIRSPIEGIIITAEMSERVNRYFREGELICEVASPAVLEAEIALPEREVARVKPYQKVELKAYALPYQTFHGRVDSIAPIAAGDRLHSTVMVYSQLDQPAAALRPGMSGYARIGLGSYSIGMAMFDRMMRFIRREFWW